jgi:integrase
LQMPRPRKDGTPARAPNKRKLTPRFVLTATYERDGPLVWDEGTKGLALSLRPNGTKTWKFIYAFRGRSRWYTIGDATALGLADAHKRARALRVQVDDDKDPQAERKAERSKGTFEELASRYVEEYAKRHNKSWQQPAALVCSHLLPRWGKLRPADITRDDVKKVMAHCKPSVANQVLAAASAIFSWAIREGVGGVKESPCRLVERNPTHARERVLSNSEIVKFWAAFDNASSPQASTALKLILLTGQRPGEVAHMRREHIDGGWWTLPGKPDPTLGWPGTKNGQTHRIWLSEPVRELIDDLDGKGPGFVLANARHRAVDQLDGEMRDICAALGVTDKVTPHDLRRTFSSRVTALSFGRDAMNRVTNHKEGGIADVYDRHGYEPENKKIMETVAAHIIDIATGADPDKKVVPMRGRGNPGLAR